MQSDAERIAAAFHVTYEKLAPDHGYETREASAVRWANVPEQNRSLMIATVERLIGQGAIRTAPTHHAVLEESDRLRAALEEILSPPDAPKGEDLNYGCLSLDEARMIARAALTPRASSEPGYDAAYDADAGQEQGRA